MILLLALCAVQADDPLRSLREKVAKAETLRVEFDVRDAGGQRLGMAIRGKLLVRGQDGLYLRIEMTEGARAGEFGEVIYDGRRTVSGGLAASDPPRLTPELLARLRRDVAVFPLLLTLEHTVNRRAAPGFEIADVQDGGLEKDRRVIRYGLKMDGRDAGKVALFIDPATGLPSRRHIDLGLGGLTVVETLTVFALGEPLPADAFVYATKGRLATAQARQLARSVELHQRFTGLVPASIDALATKPDGLDPAVFWPDGGFVLGGRVPKDPWGRAFALDGGRVTSLGADGRPGGTGEDADVAAPTAAPAGDRIAPPTERLRRHYAARLALHLTTAAARAYAEAYGEAPSDLTKLPEGVAVGPEGGWAPAGAPRDPWGEPLELRSAGGGVLVRVKDGATRAIRPSALTPEETAGLERGARAVPSEVLRKTIQGLIAALSGDNPEMRENAEDALRRNAAGHPDLLDEAIRTERDPETKGRLERVRSSVTIPVPAWRQELAGLTAYAAPGGASSGPRQASNERNASATLKTFASAQADFRGNDRDNNKIQDFWAGDVAGLYALTSEGQMIKLIEISAALADAAPLKEGAAKGRIGKLDGIWAPKGGYFFQAMTTDGTVKEAYAQDTQGEPNLGKLFNHSRFGFCAFPADYGASGTKTFIISEMNTIYWSDTGGEPALEWPDDATLRAEWKKLD